MALNRRQFIISAGCSAALPAVKPVTSAASSYSYSRIIPLDGLNWLLAVDPANDGHDRGWTKAPPDGAAPAQVPWVIQDSFPDYHGVAWYWRHFVVPTHLLSDGRYLLRFHAVDYLGEVWINGIRLGVHEGGEEPFVFDATAAIRPGETNSLAVRVLNPTHDLIDGIRLEEVAVGRRDYPLPRDNAYNTGGITGSVELILAPMVSFEDLYAAPNWKTGEILIRANLRNAGDKSVRGSVTIQCGPARGGETLSSISSDQSLGNGDNEVNLVMQVPGHRSWELNDPFLYRVTGRVQVDGHIGIDEKSIRCGFRDFRFENGYFRLNGRRIRLHGALYTVLQYPISQTTPYDEELLRRDILNMKGMGFNAIRITCGAALPRQLDLLDEIGLLAYEEHFGAREMAESPALEDRWDRSIAGVIRRDRNHPSIVMWSLLNEVKDGRLFRHAINALPRLRDLDETRVMLLGSGRFDNDPQVGSLSNPGSHVWESTGLRDVHAYPPSPHSTEDLLEMRNPVGDFTFSGNAAQPLTKDQGNLAGSWNPVLLSEFGICGAQDYPRFLRHFEQLGKEKAADAALYREKMKDFRADWIKWKLDECWPRPEDYFAESQRIQAKLALEDYNGWQANPALIGDFSSTQIIDAWFHGCGITSYFRDLKPGMADAFNDMATPVRWCLFVNEANVYSGTKVHLDAFLVNHDALAAGTYPARIQVAGPQRTRPLDVTIQIEIPKSNGREVPFSRSVFSRDLVVTGPSGRYRFLATFEYGAAAGGGEAEFYVDDTGGMPKVTTNIVLWGDDPKLAAWLRSRNVPFRRSLSQAPAARELILASRRPPDADTAQAFSALEQRIASGSSVVFLTPETLLHEPFDGRPTPLQWAPLASKNRPQLARTPNAYFRADPWGKEHPVFRGLQSGGILDYTLYRDIISPIVFRGLDPTVEAISGAIQTSGGQDDYRSDLQIAAYQFGAGRVILNSLRIRQNLDTSPTAERLLRNLLNYAAQAIE
jgi:hypothetical protein